ncbi:hypothetical protein OROMI_022379 [Orobanche minor]
MRSLRKYPSGAQKRKQKRRMDALIKLQAGSLSKYFITKNKQEQCSQNENENEVDEDEKLADGGENVEQSGAVNAKGSNGLDLPRDDSGVVKEQILLMNEKENIIIEYDSNKNTVTLENSGSDLSSCGGSMAGPCYRPSKPKPGSLKMDGPQKLNTLPFPVSYYTGIFVLSGSIRLKTTPLFVLLLLFQPPDFKFGFGNRSCNTKRSFRKYPSGAEKRKQKKRRDALIKLQAGSLSKYFITKQ